jgi:phage terminase large subunit-like protein
MTKAKTINAIGTYDTKDEAIFAARLAESNGDERWFAWPILGGSGNAIGWEIGKRSPFLGEWYDAQGIRHGGTI